jgi:diguanylate cyclase (GGDEF)-like protein/PAS domain S-box-containing protein
MPHLPVSLIVASIVVPLTAILTIVIDRAWRRATRAASSESLSDDAVREMQRTFEHRIEATEAEAEKATELYRLLAENATDMVSTHRPDGTFDYATPSWLEYVGLDAAALDGKLPVAFCHPDDVDAVIANHVRAFKATDLITTLWRCRRADGSYDWLETMTRPVRDPATGRVMTFVCTTRDVSARKRLQQTLADERHFMSALVDSLSEGIIACDADGRVTLFNRAMRDQHGRDYAEVAPDEAPRHYALYTADGSTHLSADELPLVRVLRGDAVRNHELMIVNAAGERRIVSANGQLIIDDAGRRLGAVVATRDVTAERQAQDALERSEARFRAASEGGFDAFYILEAVRDAEGTIVDFAYTEANARAAEMVRRERTELIGQRLGALSPRTVPIGLLDTFARVVAARIPLDEETRVDMPGIFAGWVHNQIVPLGDGVAVTSRDITDRKAAEVELRTLTVVDDLTGLYNRRGFRMLAEQHLRLAKRGGRSTLLFYFDVNDFKRVNDLHGHAEGDAALQQTARILQAVFRDSDIIGRLGGDEFVVLALDSGDIDDELRRRLRAVMRAHNAIVGRPYAIELSVGVARLDPHAPVSLDELMNLADAALYEEKRRRKSIRAR